MSLHSELHEDGCSRRFRNVQHIKYISDNERYNELIGKD
jgi:hypothetical protein